MKRYDAIELIGEEQWSEEQFHLHSNVMHHLREIYDVTTMQSIDEVVAEAKTNPDMTAILINGMQAEENSPPIDVIKAGVRLRLRGYKGLLIISRNEGERKNEMLSQLLNAGMDREEPYLSWVYNPAQPEHFKTAMVISGVIMYAARHNHI